jgi:hypothetical protein
MNNVPVRTDYNEHDARQIVRYPDLDDTWSHPMRRALAKKNVVVYVDEMTLINEGYGYRLHPVLGRIIRTGRETNVSAWIGSQRPKDIPSAVFTEAEHFFVFQLNWDDDRKKVVSFTSSKIRPVLDSLRAHEFVYYNVLEDTYLKGKLSETAADRH